MGYLGETSTTLSRGVYRGSVPIYASRAILDGNLDRHQSPNRGSSSGRGAKRQRRSSWRLSTTRIVTRSFKLKKQENKGRYIQSRGRRRLRIAPTAQGKELLFEEELGKTTLFPAGFKVYHRQVSCMSAKLIIENYITLPYCSAGIWSKASAWDIKARPRILLF
jgi:hypothetical protein